MAVPASRATAGALPSTLHRTRPYYTTTLFTVPRFVLELPIAHSVNPDLLAERLFVESSDGSLGQYRKWEFMTMRCSSCGLPLSPSRAQTNCPRCSTPIDPDPKAIQQPYQQPYWGHAGTAQAGTPAQTDQWAEQPPYHPPVAQIPEYQPGVLQRYPPQSPQAMAPRNFRNSRLWFSVAGLCILAAALILVFVYVSAIRSPGGTPTTTGTDSLMSLHPHTPTPTDTTAPSPTATIYPGQQYINNAQMASAINSSSLQPAQLTT